MPMPNRKIGKNGKKMENFKRKMCIPYVQKMENLYIKFFIFSLLLFFFKQNSPAETEFVKVR